MGEKSRANWINTMCFGYCKFKSNCKPACKQKDLLEDCREDCVNFNFKCNECDMAEHYEPKVAK